MEFPQVGHWQEFFIKSVNNLVQMIVRYANMQNNSSMPWNNKLFFKKIIEI